MKLALMPWEPAWWIWLVTVALLVTGLAGFTTGFVAATAVSLAQTLWYWHKAGRIRAISVQIRLAYTLLLLVCFIPELRFGYWLPTVGTSALLLCGYCLMARVLSLLPWNRLEPLSLDLIRRTFFLAPVIARLEPRSACGELNGVCELESRVALFETPGSSNRASAGNSWCG